MNELASSADGGVRELLRFATAGSVDDGKSTLVGRLLYDTKSVLADQIEAVHRASVDKGLSTPDLSLLVDGLRAEREQGITIDVAYRYFATPRREFVLADTPGHVQYTRNTVTGASGRAGRAADRRPPRRRRTDPPPRRRARAPGVPRVATNKIDLVDTTRPSTAIGKDFAELASRGITDDDPGVGAARRQRGRAVIAHPWYDGPTLLHHPSPCPSSGPANAPFRMPVQYVIRDGTTGYRGFPGRVAAGTVAPGDAIVVLPAERGPRRRGRLRRRAPPTAGAGRSVTVRLADDIDSPAATSSPGARAPTVTTELDATLCWLSDNPCAPARGCWSTQRRRSSGRWAAAGFRHRHVGRPQSTPRGAHRPGHAAPPTRCRSTTTPPSRHRQRLPVIDPPTGNTLAEGRSVHRCISVRRDDAGDTAGRTSRIRAAVGAPGDEAAAPRGVQFVGAEAPRAEGTLPGAVLVLGLQTAADQPVRRNPARNDRKHVLGPLAPSCCVRLLNEREGESAIV
jgi:sulfate adenylyltransferase subunit 1